MQKAQEALMDAFEVQRDSEGMDQAA